MRAPFTPGIVAIALLAAVVPVGVPVARADEVSPASADQAAVDLRCQFPAGKAIEVTLRFDGKGSMELSLPRDRRKVQIATTRTERFLDEMLQLDSTTNAFTQRRTWLECRETANGRVQDPARLGVAVTYTSDGSRLNASLGGRMLPQPQLERLLRHSDFVGLWIALPEAAVPATRYAFDASPLAQTLFDTASAPEVGDAWLTLDRVDPATSVAYLTARFDFTEERTDDEGTSVRFGYDVSASLELLLGERRIASCTCSGTARVSGLGRFEGMVDGSIDFTASLVSKAAGDPAAARATTAKPRVNAYALDGMDVECKLPAYWARMPRKELATLAQFIDSRDELQTLVQILRIDDEDDPTTPEFLESFKRGLAKTGLKDAVVAKAKSALGKAIRYTARLGDGRRVTGSVIQAAPGAKLSIQLIAQADAPAHVEDDLEALLKSLKPPP